MDCREFQKFVHVYIDCELDARDVGEIEGHLKECSACRAQARFESAFRCAVRHAATPAEPPPYLETRIRARLSEAAREGRPWWRSLMVPAVATTAVAGLAVFVLVERTERVQPAPLPQPSVAAAPGAPAVVASAARPSIARPAPSRVAMEADAVKPSAPAPRAVAQKAAPVRRARREPVEQEPARDARSREKTVLRGVAETVGERDLGLQLASSDVRRVRAYLESRLEHALRIPTFRGKAKVVGGSASALDGTAQIVYRHKGDDLYVHIRTHRDPTLPPRGIVLRQENGHRVAAWRQDGLTYSMTSRLDPVEMVRLVAAELNDAVRRERPRPRERLYSRPPVEPRHSEAIPASMSIGE